MSVSTSKKSRSAAVPDVGVELDFDAALDRVLGDPRSVARLKVLRAARHLIAERGLGVSMDELAEAADVGRRTLFRWFESRDALVAEALASALDWYDGRVETATVGDEELDPWLTSLVTRLHELHMASGRGLWELAASDEDALAPELAAVNARRREKRRNATAAIAESAWRRGGGSGRCPAIVVDACALTISSFATRSIVDDYGRDVRAAARSTAGMIGALVREEVVVRGAKGSRR